MSSIFSSAKSLISKITGTIITFFYLVYKDLRVFTRRKASVLLVFVSPLMIMILLGTTYSVGTDLMANSNIRGISLAVCDYDDNDISSIMIQELKESTFFDMDYFDNTFYTEAKCKEKIEREMYLGKYRVAIVFQSNFTENMLNGQTQELLFYVDNSHTEVRNTVHIFMLAYAHEMSRNVGARFIQRAWNKLDLINDGLSSMVDQLDTIQSSATSIKDNLSSSQAQLGGFDTATVRQNINDLGNQISKVEQVKGEISTAVVETKSDIDTASDRIEDIRNVTTSTKSKVTSTKQRIDSVLNPLITLHSTLIILNQTVVCPSEACDQMQTVLNSTQSTIDELQSTRDDLEALENSLDGVNMNLDQQQVILANTKVKVEQAEQGIQDVGPEIESVKVKVSTLKSTIDQVETIKQQSDQFFNQANTNIDQVISDLDSVSPEINLAKTALGQFTEYDPSTVVQPLYLNGIDIYKDRRYIDFMMPGIIGLVVMFSCLLLASISLVQEKKSGVFTRTLLTPTPLLLTISARTVSNLILSGIQILILLAVGMFMYNVQVRGDLLNVFIASEAVSLSFLTVGLIIGSFSQSENTAILASIALGLPMLFLCGLLFPSELMPSLMRLLSSFLPLTNGIDAMRNIIVYGMSIDQVVAPIGLLIGQSAVAFWISVKILKKI
jgi:ABC-type transport system involved in cytochrome c biogenesis permease component/predicted  nucleic acid-binding Zn-ribbon protein